MIEVLKHTRSICSTCGEIVLATYEVRDQEQVFFTRRCSTHGCIGYLDHPFEKEALGLSPPASFSWSGSTQPSKLRRMVPMDQRKQTWMGSRPSGKACTDCMRELQKTS